MKSSNNLAPVVMFVYNRDDHFKKTYEALSRCELAKETELFIFSDGPKNENAAEKVEAVRKALHEVKDRSDFKAVHIRESEENRGLAASIIAGVSEIIEIYGKIIVLEDDCVASPYLLSYMNDALNVYEKNQRIGSIAGFTPQLNYPDNFNDDIFLANRSCSWGWATWEDRWDNVDWELNEIDVFYKNPKLIGKLNSNGADRFIRLYRETKGNGGSWSVRFGAHLVKKNQLTIYPRYSYIENVGCDESGVHSKSEDAEKMMVDISKAIEKPKFIMPEVSSDIQKIMKKHYSGGVVSDMKRSLGTCAIVITEYITGGLWKRKN